MVAHPPAVTVRPLASGTEIHLGIDLYRTVFQLGGDDPAVSPRLLAALRHNGGSVLGAFDGRDQLVGFIYGFVGIDAGTGAVYHYSQAAAVAPHCQGRGIGRLLKHAQRDHVLQTGIATIRWAYDPLRASNAHFNLDVLGARGRWFVRNLYGVEDMGRDPGWHTDRVIVEWDLHNPGRPDAGGEVPRVEWGEVRQLGDRCVVGLPADWSATVGADATSARRVKDEVTGVLERRLAGGDVLVSCVRTDAAHAAYVLRGTG